MREGWSFEWKAGCNPVMTKDGRRTTLTVIGDVPYLTVGGATADAAPCTGHAAPAAPTDTAPSVRLEAEAAGSGVMPGPAAEAEGRDGDGADGAPSRGNLVLKNPIARRVSEQR